MVLNPDLDFKKSSLSVIVGGNNKNVMFCVVQALHVKVDITSNVFQDLLMMKSLQMPFSSCWLLTTQQQELCPSFFTILLFIQNVRRKHSKK